MRNKKNTHRCCFVLFTISLHFSESEASVSSSALERLSGELGDGTASARMNLVVHHVFQPLIISRAQENASAHLAARVPVKHGLIAPKLNTKNTKG
jgi:hypothetical protein